MLLGLENVVTSDFVPVDDVSVYINDNWESSSRKRNEESGVPTALIQTWKR